MLRDANGANVAELATATGRQLEYVRNRHAEARCTISHQDDAATALLAALASTGVPTVHCYRRTPGVQTAVCRFRGYLAPFTEQLEETAVLELAFRSPFSRLTGDGSERGRFTSETVDYPQPGTDAGLIAQQLINTTNTDGPTGLTTGLLETTKPRLRTYQYANIGEAITELAGLLDGFDFYETYNSELILATLNIAARLGADKPGARFEYGPGTLSNVRSVSRTTQPPCNRVTVLGANGLTATRSDQTSIGKYGLWPSQQSATDTDAQLVLDDKALAALRPNPVRTINFAPDYSLDGCPRPWDDFWIGDTIRFYGRRGAFNEQLSMRINTLTVVIDDNGTETFETPDPTTPEEETTIRSDLTAEII